MAALTNKFLNYEGLTQFLNKLKEYIGSEIKKVNGENLFLYPGEQEEGKNPSITSQIEDLWGVLGQGSEGGSLTEKIENIIGEYVKSISDPGDEQTLPLKISVVEGDENNPDQKDRYVISLVDNGLKDTLEDLDSNRVSKLEVGDDGGDITLSIDKNTGDVKIVINSKVFTEKVKSLEETRIKTVTEGTSTENYVDLDVSTTNLNTTITLNDSALKTKIEDIEQAISTEQTNRTNKDNELAQKDVELEEKIEDIKSSYVKDIKVVGSNGITATPTASTKGNVTITVDGTGLKQMIENLGKVVNITGVYSDGTDLTQVSGDEGDFIIVGNKEYVYWDNKWYLLGDTTQEAQDITNIAAKYNEHIHKFTPTGAVTSTFTGQSSTTNSITGTTKASKVLTPGSIPTWEDISVAPYSHTHEIKVTPTGAVTSTFTGNEVTSSSKGLTISYSKGVLSISTSHNHTVTPTGTVASTFTGEQITHTTPAADSSKTLKVHSITSAGSMPTYEEVDVANKTHTHTIIPLGTVASTFTGEEKSTPGLDATHKITLSSTRPNQIVPIPTPTPTETPSN